MRAQLSVEYIILLTVFMSVLATVILPMVNDAVNAGNSIFNTASLKWVMDDIQMTAYMVIGAGAASKASVPFILPAGKCIEFDACQIGTIAKSSKVVAGSPSLNTAEGCAPQFSRNLPGAVSVVCYKIKKDKSLDMVRWTAGNPCMVKDAGEYKCTLTAV